MQSIQLDGCYLVVMRGSHKDCSLTGIMSVLNWGNILCVLTVICLAAASSLETMGEEVKVNPVEEVLDTELNDLFRSMSSIHDHVKNITNTQLGNYSVVIDGEIKTANKDITYDNLMEKIKLAKNKIKTIQSKVSSTMADLETNWPKANITRHHP